MRGAWPKIGADLEIWLGIKSIHTSTAPYESNLGFFTKDCGLFYARNNDSVFWGLNVRMKHTIIDSHMISEQSSMVAPFLLAHYLHLFAAFQTVLQTVCPHI